MDVTGGGACVQRALDAAEPDVAGRGADVGGAADVAQPDVAARGLHLGVPADLVQIEVAGCRLCVQLAEPASAAQVGRSGLGAESRTFGRVNAQAHVQLAQEAESEPAPRLYVDHDLVAAAGLAKLDPRVVEKLSDLVCASAGVELDLGGRGRPRLDVDASRGHAQHERHLAGGFERLAPHDRRPRTRRMISRDPGRPSLWGSRESTRTSMCPSGRWTYMTPP